MANIKKIPLIGTQINKTEYAWGSYVMVTSKKWTIILCGQFNQKKITCALNKSLETHIYIIVFCIVHLIRKRENLSLCLPSVCVSTFCGFTFY